MTFYLVLKAIDSISKEGVNNIQPTSLGHRQPLLLAQIKILSILQLFTSFSTDIHKSAFNMCESLQHFTYSVRKVQLIDYCKQ